MKKLFPILLAVALFSTACQLGGGSAEPTPIALPDAGPDSNTCTLKPHSRTGIWRYSSRLRACLTR